MMLKKLSIENFQSHKSSELDFSPGVNTIIGSSDHGKSSIFRALNFICNNKPEGNAFVSHWLLDDKNKCAGNSVCKLEVDGHIIQRKKGKVNEYSLDEEVLTAFQRNVPEAISKLINIGEANLQHQSNSFFLLDLSSNKVAEELNKIVNLEIIDDSVNNINSKLRETRAAQKVNKDLIEEYELNLKNFDDIEEREVELKKLFYLENDISLKHNKVLEITKYLFKIENILNEINIYNVVTSSEDVVNSFIDSSLKLKTKQEFVKNLQTIISQVLETFSYLAKCNKVIEKEKNVKLLFNLKLEIKKLESIEKLSNDLKQISELKSEIENLKKSIDYLEREYNKLLPDVCPLCNRPIKNEIHTDSR